MNRYRIVATVTVVALVVLVGTAAALRDVALRTAEKSLMVLHANGAERPDDFGALSERVWIRSGQRNLQALLVRAPGPCSDAVAVLLFHGRGETISGWAKVQAFLARQCVSSMVFDYSGHGSSTPPARIATLNADAVAAYGDFVRRFPDSRRRCILGHSMGVAPMLDAYPSLAPVPDCTVVANGFSSLQEFAHAEGAPAPIAFLLGSVWNNLRAIGRVDSPLLVIHGDRDQVIDPAMARRLDEAAPASALRVTARGFGHNALYTTPGIAWWAPVLAFLHRPADRTG
ncbi:MAG: alpha/beta hydrolase [Janthinobacterium lividum]